MAITFGKIRVSEISMEDSNQGHGYALGMGNFYVTGAAGGLVSAGAFGITSLQGGFFHELGTSGGEPVDFYLSDSTVYPNSISLPSQNSEYSILVFGKGRRDAVENS